MESLNDRYKKNAFFSKIKGVTMESSRQGNISKLRQADKLYPVFEDDNQFDANAIKLFADEAHTKDLGYISKDLAPDLREFRKNKVDFDIRVTHVTGGMGNKSFGCNILIILRR